MTGRFTRAGAPPKTAHPRPPPAGGFRAVYDDGNRALLTLPLRDPRWWCRLQVQRRLTQALLVQLGPQVEDVPLPVCLQARPGTPADSVEIDCLLFLAAGRLAPRVRECRLPIGFRREESIRVKGNVPPQPASVALLGDIALT